MTQYFHNRIYQRYPTLKEVEPWYIVRYFDSWFLDGIIQVKTTPKQQTKSQKRYSQVISQIKRVPYTLTVSKSSNLPTGPQSSGSALSNSTAVLKPQDLTTGVSWTEMGLKGFPVCPRAYKQSP